MPKYTQPRKTWFYPVNFKIKAVELSLRDDSLLTFRLKSNKSRSADAHAALINLSRAKADFWV